MSEDHKRPSKAKLARAGHYAFMSEVMAGSVRGAPAEQMAYELALEF